jgi:lipopolysaccharide transport system permease protein
VTHNLVGLFRSRDLLFMLTWRDIHVRYKQSIMGLFWSILMPGLIVGAGVLVRVAAAQYSGGTISMDDISSVMVRAVPWAFFIAGIRFATNSLISNSNLVTKIAFPKEVFPISAVLSNFFDFVIAGAVVVVIMLFTGWRPTLAALWFAPLMFMLILFTVALAMILAAANLFYRDVKYLVEVFLTYAIFFTPVLYPASMLGKWENLIMLNPIAPLLEGIANSVVLGAMPDPAWTAYSVMLSLLLLIIGYWMFKRLESKFAESI